MKDVKIRLAFKNSKLFRPTDASFFAGKSNRYNKRSGEISMNFRAFGAAGLIWLVGAMGTTAFGEVPLKDNSEIVGTWRLESVAPALNKPKIEENRTWEFKSDGTIVTSGYNRHFKAEDRHEWKYKIVDGKIVADDPGRPGKTIDYMVYEKTPDRMILKGGIEGFYFFKKQ